MIRQCDSSKCYSPFQDLLYGRGMRVMNECAKGRKCRCTVCKAEYNMPEKKKADNSSIMGVKKK